MPEVELKVVRLTGPRKKPSKKVMQRADEGAPKETRKKKVTSPLRRAAESPSRPPLQRKYRKNAKRQGPGLIRDDEASLCGPHIWPVPEVPIHDRFFFQWPERSYLSAIAELNDMNARDGIDEIEIETRIVILHGSGQKRHFERIACWRRVVRINDPAIDVREWISELQLWLRVLPDRPFWDRSIRLEYFRPARRFEAYALAVSFHTYGWL